jgi:ADP-ribose pyrophosphatase YjhB (NUDIX family)
MIKIKAYGICLYKIVDNNIYILLCKSVQSNERWGLLKGKSEKDETPIQTALREFEEESSIKLKQNYLEQYFEQINDTKDIGIWLVNFNKLSSIQKQYFIDNTLKRNHLSWENSKVKFFDIKDLPQIKKKQKYLIKQIKDYLQNTHQSH